MSETKINNFFSRLQSPETTIQIGKLDSVQNISGENFDFQKYVDENKEGGDLYFLAGVDPKQNKRAGNKDIIKKNYFTLDFDIKEVEGGEYDKEKLYRIASEIIEKLESGGKLAEYSMINISGNGLHVHYIGDWVDVTDFEMWKLGLEYIFSAINESIYPVDMACTNTARLMRVPGSVNHKDKNIKKEVEILKVQNIKSRFLNEIMIYGAEQLDKKEEERKAWKKAREERQKDVNGSNNVLEVINEIDIVGLVCEFYPVEYKDGKSNRFFHTGGFKSTGYFKDKEDNRVVWAGSTEIPEGVHGDPFNFIRTHFGWEKNKDGYKRVFEWFKENYQHIKDLDDQEKDDWKKNNKPDAFAGESFEEVEPKDVPKELFKIAKSGEILKMTPKEVPFVVDRMMAERTITAITAKSGVGKSLFALILAKHIAEGTTLFDNFSVIKQNVLIIDQEMPDDILVGRYKAIVKRGEGVDYIWQQSWVIEDEQHFTWLKNAIKENEYGVVVFDMLDSIHEKNENDNSEMKVINKKLMRLINETGVSVIILHQHRKEDNRTKSSQDSAQGAGDIIHKASSHLIIEKTGKTDMTEFGEEKVEYLLKQEKSRRPEVMKSFKFNIYYSEERQETEWEFVGFHDEKLVAIEQAKNSIIKFLKENSGIWFLGSKKYPEKDMLKSVEEMTGIKPKNIKNAARSLVEEEIIQSVGKSPIGYFME